MITFDVVDRKTGKSPNLREIVKTEPWAKELDPDCIEGFFLSGCCDLILADECGNYVFCPSERFRVDVEFDNLFEKREYSFVC